MAFFVFRWCSYCSGVVFLVFWVPLSEENSGFDGVCGRFEAPSCCLQRSLLLFLLLSFFFLLLPSFLGSFSLSFPLFCSSREAPNSLLADAVPGRGRSKPTAGIVESSEPQHCSLPLSARFISLH